MGIDARVQASKQRFQMSELQTNNVSCGGAHCFKQLLREIAREVALEYLLLDDTHLALEFCRLARKLFSTRLIAASRDAQRDPLSLVAELRERRKASAMLFRFAAQ